MVTQLPARVMPVLSLVKSRMMTGWFLAVVQLIIFQSLHSDAFWVQAPMVGRSRPLSKLTRNSVMARL